MNPHVASGRIGDLPQIAGTEAGDPAGWTPLRHLLGVRAFGINAWHGNAEGDLVIEEHDELPEGAEGGHEELYLVLSGHARFVIDGDELDAPAGAVVAIAPNLRRAARAVTGGTTIVAVGAPLGEAFAPSAWEARAIERAGLS